MYLAQSIGNIVQKFNDQQINVIYDISNSLFDIHMGLCNINLFLFDTDLSINDENINFVKLKQPQVDLFNYNAAFTNNILAYASNMKYTHLHINAAIFVHSYKPAQIKKEDLVLIDNNIYRNKKIFFSQQIADSWKLRESEIISYGIDTKHFYNEISLDDRSSKLLIMSYHGKNATLNALSQILSNNNIEFDIIDTLKINTEFMRQTFNRYRMCLDLSENIINSLTAISCGCKAIAYNTYNIRETLSSVPNLYFCDSIIETPKVVKLVDHQQTINHMDYFDSNFNFDTFQRKISDIVNYLNRETFYI